MSFLDHFCGLDSRMIKFLDKLDEAFEVGWHVEPDTFQIPLPEEFIYYLDTLSINYILQTEFNDLEFEELCQNWEDIRESALDPSEYDNLFVNYQHNSYFALKLLNFFKEVDKMWQEAYNIVPESLETLVETKKIDNGSKSRRR